MDIVVASLASDALETCAENYFAFCSCNVTCFEYEPFIAGPVAEFS